MAADRKTNERLAGSVVPRWVLWGAAAAAVFMVVGGIVLATFWPFTSPKVIAALEEEWPGKITVQSSHSIYFPHPGCVLEGMEFRRGNDPAVAPVVAIQKVTVAANYHDLFLRPGFVSRIMLEGLKVAVPAQQAEAAAPSQQGKSKLSKTRVGEIYTKDALLEIGREKDSPLRFDVHELVLNSVTGSGPMKYRLAMHNPQPPGEIHAQGEFGPYNADHLEAIPLQGDYTFDQVDLSAFDGLAGALTAKGEFHGALGKIETQGNTDVPDFEVRHSEHRVHIKAKYQALVDGTGGDTTLQSVDAVIGRTNAHFDGSVTGKSGQPGKFVSASIAVKDGYIEDVLRVFVKEHKSALDGKTDIHAKVSWPSAGDNFLKKVKLDGEFSVDGAHSEHNRLRNDMIELSKRASGKKNDKTPIDENIAMDLKGKVAVAKGVANLTDTFFSIPGAEANLHGTYDLTTTKVDFHGTLKTEATVSQDAGGAKGILLKPLDPLFKRKHAGAVIPVQLTGTFHDAHVGLAIPIPK
jgi:AsmA-like C-terminal region